VIVDHPYPSLTKNYHYEIELVLRISKNGKYIHQSQACKYYNGITVGIDFTARDVQRELQKKGLPWEKAKAWDNSAVIGNWFDISPDIKKNPIEFSLKLNDTLVQNGSSADMIFSFDQIVADISQYFALNIGDLIFTGTPAGVGECVVGDNLKGFLGSNMVFDLDVK